MNKAVRDRLRYVLDWHPDVVPIPGVETVKELLDQIDELEAELEQWQEFKDKMMEAIIP